MSPSLALPLDRQGPQGTCHGCPGPQFPHPLSGDKCGPCHLWLGWALEGHPRQENQVSLCLSSATCHRVSSLPLCLPSHVTGLLPQFPFWHSCLVPGPGSCQALRRSRMVLQFLPGSQQIYQARCGACCSLSSPDPASVSTPATLTVLRRSRRNIHHNSYEGAPHVPTHSYCQSSCWVLT